MTDDKGTNPNPPPKPPTVEDLRDLTFSKTFDQINKLRHRWSLTYTDAALTMILIALLNRK